MNKKYHLSGLCFGLAFFITGFTWADCASPYENPFDEAQDVYLAEVVAIQSTKQNFHTTSAQIKVLKIYKTKNIESVKNLNNLSSISRWGAEQFEKGGLYLLHNEPVWHQCNIFGNKQVSQDEIRLFEQQHKPVWATKERENNDQ